ncbi:MAG: methyltransferase family protein [Steroidobacteraceae bacterium]
MSLNELYDYFLWSIWALWLLAWLVFARDVKVTVHRQAALPRLFNMALLLCASVLLLDRHVPVAVLTERVLPGSQWKFWAAVGAALTLLGVLFMVWARIHLGRNWSGVSAVKADHELITGGPYRWVRHPIYSGLALALLGTATAIGQWRGVLAVALALSAIAHRVIVEERFMRQQFGAAYDTYTRRVRALVPGLINEISRRARAFR